MDYYQIPAIQAMIRYHHSKLQSYIWRPFIFGLLLLDLFQILFQMVFINRIIEVSGDNTLDSDYVPDTEDAEPLAQF